ncbi:CPCC family cysteine-rich protein [Mycobacterium sp. URHB0044]|jgi:hypothetical protein|uniref:CPCC family cysteine-rich protein n=1 Tax=Mycobacterium sp. URHB0044 TaxID=1380386 RepID=UPI000685BCD4|nr:CPCC family cysteine-rich protein [Mycobacterium sp. URHB0044]
MRTVARDEIVEHITQIELGGVTAAERQRQLEVMCRENWSEHPAWLSLTRDVRRELEDRELQHPASSPRYDAVLLMWLRTRYRLTVNDFLRDRARALGIEVDEVVGEEPAAQVCPCCGYATLDERGAYNICHVCWWEDDGTDNDDADKVYGGPNSDVSLTQGRANFLAHGTSDPRRDDLLPLHDPPERYRRVRTFVLSTDRREVSEPKQGWTSRVFVLAPAN